MSKTEIRLAGFGGQGIVLLGNIIGKAASIYNKQYAALTQSYGPESRGGSCRAEVIISGAPIEYPYISNPQIQVILSQEAYNEFGANAPEGTLLLSMPNWSRWTSRLRPKRSPSRPAASHRRWAGRW